MSRRVKTDIPGEDWRVTIEQVREAGGFEKIFAGRAAKPLPLVVELGFGRGEFLIALAEAHPDQAYVGVEYSSKRTTKMARRIARLEVRNIALVEARAEDVLRDALCEESVACFWLNFPDPWPKARHHRRRFVQKETLERITRRLIPGGVLRVATDDADYAEWIDEHLTAAPGLANVYAPEPWRREAPGRMPTAYEEKWRGEGRRFHFFEYERLDGERGRVPK